MPADPIEIRTATMEDFEVIARFNEAMSLETEARRLHPATIRSGVRRVLEDPACGVYFIARAAGSPVGQLLVTREWSDWRCGWFWWIQSVYVVAERRRGGVYRALHRHVEAEARRAGGVCGIRLYVDADNTRAQQVYEALGMARTHYRLFETDWSGAEPRKPQE